MRLYRGRPDLHPGALLPLLRHGHGQPRGDLARGLHGHPRTELRSGRDPGGRRAGGRDEPLRGADDVHRRAGTERFHGLRRVHPAHRHHGRFAVPGRGDEAGHRPDGDARGRDLLRDDGDVAGLDDDAQRRRSRAADRDGRAGHAAPGGQGRRPGDRSARAARRARGAVHARLLGDARLLGAARQDRRGDRHGPLDAHRRPRDDGRVRLLLDRRPDQGHGDPRRGEHLPA